MSAFRFMVYDKTQTGRRNNFLSSIWSLGGSLFGAFNDRFGASSWAEVYDHLRTMRGFGVSIDHFQFWGHGDDDTGPMINGESMDVNRMAASIPLSPNGVCWYRACAVGRGPQGHAFALQHVAKIGRVALHTRIVSGDEHGKPSLRTVWYQSGLYGLRPGETPHWPISDRGGSGRDEPNTVSVFSHNIPREAWQERARGPAAA